jgi:hypothetical protein
MERKEIKMSDHNGNWKSAPRWVRIVVYSILGVIGAAALGVLFGLIIMWLWNWLMPMLFGLKTITYWEGVGIFILAKILFGSIGSSGGESKKSKDKKERRIHVKIGKDEKAEAGDEERYDEWWETEGKKAFEEYAKDKREDKENT